LLRAQFAGFRLEESLMKMPLRFSAVLSGLCLLGYVAVALVIAPGRVSAQEQTQPDRAKVIAAAREIMGAQTYCALVTVGETGRPYVRTMNPFPPEEDMTVWFATSVKSRKAEQIRRDPRVCVYYADHSKAVGSVILSGKATLVDDQNEIKKRYRAYWDQAFPDKKNLVLIKVVAEDLEVLNYKQGLNNEKVTFRAPSLKLGAAASQE
jgi:general stress protein 26